MTHPSSLAASAPSRRGGQVLAACLAAALAACNPAAKSVTPSTGAAKTAAKHVDTRPAVAQKVPRVVPVLGSLTSDRRTQLAANATGRVTTVLVERGQKVEKNQVLLTLDVRSATHTAREARANLQNLQAMRAVAQGDCKRFEALQQKQAITQQEYERAMAQCREADAQYEGAEARNQEALRTLQDGEVRAPFAGVVTERTVNVGDYVRADSPVATLLVPDPLRLACGIPEAFAQAAKPGSPIYFEVAAYPGREFHGEVRYVSGEVRTQTRDILVEAVVQNPNDELLPGMFATAFLVVGERTLPVVAKTAVLQAGAEKVVFLVKGGSVEQHVVRLGREVGEDVAIESGLDVGDKVIWHPDESIVDGMSVE